MRDGQRIFSSPPWEKFARLPDMLEARLQRETELTALIQNDRTELVRIYCTATGCACENPDVIACVAMVRDILDVELPLDGSA